MRICLRNTAMAAAEDSSSVDPMADVVGLPGVHIECKRVEKLNLYAAVEQSRNDAREAEIPVVMHRKNRREWLVTMPLKEWMKMYER